MLASEVDESSSSVSYTSKKPGFFTPEMVAEKYEIAKNEEVQVTVMKGLPGSSANIVSTGDIVIVNEGSLPVNNRSFTFDSNGEIFFKITTTKPFTNPGTVSLISSLNQSCFIEVSIKE